MSTISDQSACLKSSHLASNEPFAGAQVHHCAKNGEAGMYRMVRPNTMKFYYVYVLRSLVKKFVYVGFTGDLKKRFLEHNSGSEFSTKPYIPYELIHYEAYRNIQDAKRREGYFKTSKDKTTLKTMLKEFLEK